MSRWYRAYEGTVTDAKIGEVAMIASCTRSVSIAAWHALLENCASANDGGRFDMTARRLAVILGEPVESMAAVLNAFEELGMTAGGTVTAWSNRQFESDRDPTAPERARRYRRRVRDERDASRTVTRDDRDAIRPESYTESESEKNKEPLANASGAAPKGRPELPGTPVIGEKANPIQSDSLPSQALALADTPRPPGKYETCLQALWDSGLPSLRAMGVSEKTARRLLGLWLRDCDQDPARVLSAIEAAKKRGIVDPVPWITAGFAKIKEKRTHADDRKNALVTALGSPPAGDYGSEHFYVARDDEGNLDTGRGRKKGTAAYSGAGRK